MKRQTRTVISLVLCSLTSASSCKPTQPFFFAEDGNILGKGDLSHYINVATDIEYPDVNSLPLDEVTEAAAPFTLTNSENFDVWDITLEEVTRITLTNSKVIRQLGGRISDGGSNIAVSTPETLQQGMPTPSQRMTRPSSKPAMARARAAPSAAPVWSRHSRSSMPRSTTRRPGIRTTGRRILVALQAAYSHRS